MPDSAYEKISRIAELELSDRTVLLIGAGWMARQYAGAMAALGITKVTVLSRRQISSEGLAKDYGFQALSGGFEKQLPHLPHFDLTIIATPVESLLPAAKMAIAHGQDRLLIEKPGALSSRELGRFAQILSEQVVRIAYNRLVYPNYLLLKELVREEGGITSCFYTFTEWVHVLDFNQHSPEVFARWGLANSLHVVSMAHHLIGIPSQLQTFREGGFPWHPTGAVFTGSGVSDQGIPFSYHADWTSAGRWGIEVMTELNAFRLIPLEGLFRCQKGTVAWKEVPFEVPFPEAKQGVAEEIAAMFDPQFQEWVSLPAIEAGVRYLELGEQIFGYRDSDILPNLSITSIE